MQRKNSVFKAEFLRFLGEILLFQSILQIFANFEF
nr:MAG TPA: hypothetical protein [Caudoviricetes sp.]